MARVGFPHALLLSGPSGVGKTTVANLVAKRLKAHHQDYHRLNAADFNGIDMVRQIRSKLGVKPLYGETKVYLLDEAHRLTSAAQDAMLRMLEETPMHVYFILATTEPQKLVRAVRTRVTEIKLVELEESAIRDLVTMIAEKEGMALSTEALEGIVTMSMGSAREALKQLSGLRGIAPEAQFNTLMASDTPAESFRLCRQLLDHKTRWQSIANQLTRMEGEDPEQIRHMVLGYARKALLNGGNGQSRAYYVIDAFRNNFYDSGKAGLTAACFEVFCSKVLEK
jgi:DNA polymerase-3 subunit gamma/tau